MSQPDLTIVIPTVSGREDHLARAVASYEAHTAMSFELLTFKDLPGVAFGWQRGAETARGRYIHLSNDDGQVVAGWDTAAAACVDDGYAPAPRVFDGDGGLWEGGTPDIDPRFQPDGALVPMSTVPFLSRDWWPHVTPLPPGMHYFTDNYIAWRLGLIGVRTRLTYGYDIVHNWASEHRGAGWTESERMVVDQQYANMALAIIQRGAAALAAPAKGDAA